MTDCPFPVHRFPLLPEGGVSKVRGDMRGSWGVWIGAVIGCALLASPAGTQPQEKLKVVTTYGFLRYAAEQVGGARVSVEALAHPRQDPHTVTPSPDFLKKARDARLFVQLGRALDLWAKNVLDACGNDRIQPGSDGYVLAGTSCSVEELPGEVSREKGDVHPEGNPHVWLDPLNFKTIAKNIAEGLKRVDPAGAGEYDRNLADFAARIDRALFGEDLLREIGPKRVPALERQLRAGTLAEYLKGKGLENRLGGWLKKADPLRGKKVISYHKTFTYFAKVFGLRIVTEIEARPGIPPTVADRDRAVQAVRENGVRLILHENYYSTSASDYVAEQTGAQVVVLFTDVGATEQVGDYFRLIDWMLDRLVEAVK